MFQTFILRCAAVLCLFLALAGITALAQSDARPPAKAEAFMTAYRTNENVEAKLRSLRGLERFRTPAVDDFLLAEYSKLDNSQPADAQLLKNILRI